MSEVDNAREDGGGTTHPRIWFRHAAVAASMPKVYDVKWTYCARISGAH